MKKREFYGCVAALVMGSVSTTLAQPAFRSGVELVEFAVTVVDEDGGLVRGLTADDFVISEEGQEQQIAYFSQGVERDLETMPLHVGVLFDASGSMDEDADFATTAVLQFLRSLDFATDTTLVQFAEEVWVSRFGPVDFPRLVERLRGREGGGMTALYDALGVYLDGAFSQDGRKILLLYTDGDDTRSRIRFDELLDLVRASDVTAYVVGFNRWRRAEAGIRERVRLEQIAHLTGGRAYFPNSAGDLEEIYAEIRGELIARYSLGYVSTDPATDGAWRRVTIGLRTSRSDLQDTEIRAREGYFAPYLEPEPGR